MSACPKCGGTGGFTFSLVERGHFSGDWGGGVNLDDSVRISASRLECIDCFGQFNYENAREKGYFTHGQ